MRFKTAVVLLVLAQAGSPSANTPDASDAFYQAIRQSDLAAMRHLARESGVDTKDAQGQTPLVLAAAFGSADAVRLLISAGADVKLAGSGGVTPLHAAATNPVKTRLLLEAGADVRAVSLLGRTPLLVAAATHGSAATIKLLLAKGADVNAADPSGLTPLTAAAVAGDLETVRLLLASGANPRATAKTGMTTALLGAATNGDVVMARTLLARGTDLHALAADSSVNGRNGPVQFGRIGALHFAALSGDTASVQHLIAAGSDVNARDIRGMTALMMAIATDRPQPAVIRALLDAGADPAIRSNVNEDAFDWARKFNHPDVLALMKMPASSPKSTPDTSTAPALPLALTPRGAVQRALPLLRSTSARVLTAGGCVACHAQPLTGLAVNAARARGWTMERPDTELRQALTQVTTIAPGLLQLRDGGGLPDGLVYIAALLAAEGQAPTRATDTLVHYLAAKQRKNGSWVGVGGTRAPMQDGDVSRTALSIKALTTYATPARRQEYATTVVRAADWVAKQVPVSTEDRIMQLLGLKWAGAHERVRRARTAELLATQRSDGGWAQTPHLESDAYATGQVLYALRELGVTPSDTVMQRGVAFLLQAQRADGSWLVRSRAMKVQPYFQSGFPYEHDQWISHAGSAWATMALSVASAGD